LIDREFVELALVAHALNGIAIAQDASMTTHRPVPGDFLIHQVAPWAGVLIVGADRDHPQLSCQTYPVAVAHAKRAAAHSNVDVWQTKDGACFERLASYRDTES